MQGLRTETQMEINQSTSHLLRNLLTSQPAPDAAPDDSGGGVDSGDSEVSVVSVLSVLSATVERLTLAVLKTLTVFIVLGLAIRLSSMLLEFFSRRGEKRLPREEGAATAATSA